MYLLTEYSKGDFLGGLAQTVDSSQGVEGRVLPLGLLDEKGTLVLGYQLVGVLVILHHRLLLRLGQLSFVPGEGGEGAAGDLGQQTDVTSFLSFHCLTHLDSRGAYRERYGLVTTRSLRTHGGVFTAGDVVGDVLLVGSYMSGP